MRALLPALTVACIGAAFTCPLVATPVSAAVGPVNASVAPAPLPVTKAAFYCSPGFELNYAEQCVAVPSRAEVQLFVDQPIYGTDETVVRHSRHRHMRKGIRERY